MFPLVRRSIQVHSPLFEAGRHAGRFESGGVKHQHIYLLATRPAQAIPMT